jgi:GNAT superfamily N-acetyltransferase
MTETFPDYGFQPRVADPDEHRALARAVGWDDHFDGNTIPNSLDRSLTGIVVMHSGSAVGMGRLVGDGEHYFYLQDVIVHPDHTEGGLGSEIVSRLLAWVADHTPAPAFVGLFASDEAIGLYEGFGFTTEGMTGMHRFVDPKEPI